MPDLGRYGVFVWPAYGLSALVLGWAAVQSLLAARRWRREAERPPGPPDSSEGGTER